MLKLLKDDCQSVFRLYFANVIMYKCYDSFIHFQTNITSVIISSIINFKLSKCRYILQTRYLPFFPECNAHETYVSQFPSLNIPRFYSILHVYVFTQTYIPFSSLKLVTYHPLFMEPVDHIILFHFFIYFKLFI